MPRGNQSAQTLANNVCRVRMFTRAMVVAFKANERAKWDAMQEGTRCGPVLFVGVCDLAVRPSVARSLKLLQRKLPGEGLTLLSDALRKDIFDVMPWNPEEQAC